MTNPTFLAQHASLHFFNKQPSLSTDLILKVNSLNWGLLCLGTMGTWILFVKVAKQLTSKLIVYSSNFVKKFHRWDLGILWLKLKFRNKMTALFYNDRKYLKIEIECRWKIKMGLKLHKLQILFNRFLSISSVMRNSWAIMPRCCHPS